MVIPYARAFLLSAATAFVYRSSRAYIHLSLCNVSRCRQALRGSQPTLTAEFSIILFPCPTLTTCLHSIMHSFPVLSLPVLSLPPVLPGLCPCPPCSYIVPPPRRYDRAGAVTPSRTRSNKKELDITPANKRTPYLYMNLYSWYRKTMAIPLYSLRR